MEDLKNSKTVDELPGFIPLKDLSFGIVSWRLHGPVTLCQTFVNSENCSLDFYYVLNRQIELLR